MSSSYQKKSTKPYARCADSHKPLVIGVSQHKAFQIMGGSVYSVKPAKWDVIISFEGSYKGSEMALPWTPGVEFTYRIPDGQAPSNPTNFIKLVEWVAHRLHEGDKVFCGCIGGHGRTGMFLAALVNHMTGEKDAIRYVRKHYCKKAVESEAQVVFLKKHFGITKAEPSKGTQTWTGWGSMTGPGFKSRTDDYYTVEDLWKPGDEWVAPVTQVKNQKADSSRGNRKVNVKILSPVPTELSIHGDNENVI